MPTVNKQTPYGPEERKRSSNSRIISIIDLYRWDRRDNIMSNLGKTIGGDEYRHRDLHGQYRHPTPTMHSPRASMPRINMGNDIP